MCKKKLFATKALTVLWRWIVRYTTRSLKAWHGLVVEEERKRAMIGKIVQRLKGLCVSAALSTWTLYMEEAQIGRRMEERQQLVMTKILMRMLHVLLESAYGLWASNAADLVKNRSVMGKILARMSHRATSIVIDVWRYQVDHGKEDRRG